MVFDNPLIAFWSWCLRFMVLVILGVAAWPLALLWLAWNIHVILRDRRRRNPWAGHPWEKNGHNGIPASQWGGWDHTVVERIPDPAAYHPAYDDWDT